MTDAEFQQLKTKVENLERAVEALGRGEIRFRDGRPVPTADLYPWIEGDVPSASIQVRGKIYHWPLSEK